MLSSLSKSRISIFNVHLTLFVRRMMSQNSIGKYRYLVNSLGTEHRHTRIVAELERSECRELRLRRGSPLTCGVMCFVSSSLHHAYVKVITLTK